MEFATAVSLLTPAATRKKEVALRVPFNVGAPETASVGSSSATVAPIASTAPTRNVRKAVVLSRRSDAPRAVSAFPGRVFAMATEIVLTTRTKRSVTADEDAPKVPSDVTTDNVYRRMSSATRSYLVEMVATNLEEPVERDIAVE